jgi:replicative DNA helicase
MTQCEQILRHLRERGSITQKEAVNEYGIYRLSARILDLRQQGHEIETEMEGEGRDQHARYYLKQTAMSL